MGMPLLRHSACMPSAATWYHRWFTHGPPAGAGAGRMTTAACAPLHLALLHYPTWCCTHVCDAATTHTLAPSRPNLHLHHPRSTGNNTCVHCQAPGNLAGTSQPPSTLHVQLSPSWPGGNPPPCQVPHTCGAHQAVITCTWRVHIKANRGAVACTHRSSNSSKRSRRSISSMGMGQGRSPQKAQAHNHSALLAWHKPGHIALAYQRKQRSDTLLLAVSPPHMPKGSGLLAPQDSGTIAELHICCSRPHQGQSVTNQTTQLRPAPLSCMAPVMHVWLLPLPMPRPHLRRACCHCSRGCCCF
jgi:hypothetical protein